MSLGADWQDHRPGPMLAQPLPGLLVPRASIPRDPSSLDAAAMLLPPDASLVFARPAMPPACLLGWAPPRVQEMLSVKAASHYPVPQVRYLCVILSQSALSLRPSMRSTPTRSTVTKDNPASVRPSHGPRRHSATHQVRGLCGIAPLSNQQLPTLIVCIYCTR